MTFPPFFLASTCCPRIARVASSAELGTMSKNNLRWFPSKRTRHRFPMKLRMLLLQDKEILKKEGVTVFVFRPKCWQIRLLRRLLVTFSNLRAQQISSIILLCSVIHHTALHFLWLSTHLRPKKNFLKYPAFFILWRKHNLDMRCWVRYISLCSIYFIC